MNLAEKIKTCVDSGLPLKECILDYKNKGLIKAFWRSKGKVEDAVRWYFVDGSKLSLEGENLFVENCIMKQITQKEKYKILLNFVKGLLPVDSLQSIPDVFKDEYLSKRAADVLKEIGEC